MGFCRCRFRQQKHELEGKRDHGLSERRQYNTQALLQLQRIARRKNAGYCSKRETGLCEASMTVYSRQLNLCGGDIHSGSDLRMYFNDQYASRPDRKASGIVNRLQTADCRMSTDLV